MSDRVAVIGQAEWVEWVEGDTARASLESMIFETAWEALASAGLERGELGGIVLSASDQTDGRAISSMLTSGPAGAYFNDEINIASSPGHALAMAYLAIVSGLHRRVLVASWGKASEISVEGGHAATERLSTDPYYERDAGLSPTAALALQAQAHRASSSLAEEGARAVVVKNRANGVRNERAVVRSPLGKEEFLQSPPLAYPLRHAEVAPECDGVFALVLAVADPSDRIVIEGIGWCADSSRLGERDLIGLPHLREAARRSYALAGIVEPHSQLDLCELQDATGDAEVLAYEALGFCEPGGGPALALSGRTALDGALPINPSGGSLAGEAPFGGSLRKVIEVVRQLGGEAGSVQVEGAERAVVHVASGFAGQFQTVAVLGVGT